MNWTDEGLLLSVKPYGERAAVIQVLTEHKGLHAGLIQNAFSRKMHSTLQPSNQLHLNWCPANHHLRQSHQLRQYEQERE